jgi:transcriptional regulator with XRE-family HTH domain
MEMEDEVRIAHVLKHLMSEKGLTFKELSRLSGVPISTLKTWSAGVEPKSFSSARKVARILSVSVEHLVFGSTDKTQFSLQDLPTTKLFSGWCKVSIGWSRKRKSSENASDEARVLKAIGIFSHF